MHVVAVVVREACTKSQAIDYVAGYAQDQIDDSDRDRFLEVVHTQLLSLHEGNIARYRIRPSQHHAWQQNWAS